MASITFEFHGSVVDDFVAACRANSAGNSPQSERTEIDSAKSAGECRIPLGSTLRLPALVPRRPGADRQWLQERLQSWTLPEPPTGERDRASEIALRAGLLIWHDFLDEAHALAQSIEGQAAGRGDHWHAIMHRREPDYANARYWFRRVRRPTWYSELARMLIEGCRSMPWLSPDDLRFYERIVSEGQWDPLRFVDACEAAGDEQSDPGWTLRQLQRAEMTLLLADCAGLPVG